MKVSNILKVIDIESRDLSEDFKRWLSQHSEKAYTDNILKEHLYGCEIIEDITQFHAIPEVHRHTLQTISDLCRQHEAGYFRIIS